MRNAARDRAAGRSAFAEPGDIVARFEIKEDPTLGGGFLFFLFFLSFMARRPAGARVSTRDAGIRNLIASDWPGLADLSLRGRWQDKYGIYGVEIEYRDPYAVDLDRARFMVRTLERVHREEKKIAGRAGPPGSFGARCQRIASILGCVGMVEEDPNGRASWLQETEFRTTEPDGIASRVDFAIAQRIAEETAPAAAGGVS